MSITSPAEIAKTTALIETQCGKLTEEAKKTLGLYKKKAAEFETVRGGLLEGSTMIIEHQKELVTMYGTFDKMTVKLDGIRKEMEAMGKSLRNTEKLVKEAIPDIRELGKDADKLLPINKGNTLLKDAKATTVALDKSLCDLRDNIGTAAGDCEALPGPVPRPK